MNGYWLRITTSIAAALLFGACVTDKFSELFSTEIQQDCIQTVGCYQMGQIESCIASVGETLDTASTSKQQWFVDAAYRCSGQTTCAWVTCVQSTNDTGFAAMRLAQITWDCQQRAICRNAADAMEDTVRRCIQETGNSLNADVAAQTAFDARQARCGQEQGCNYGACQ